MFKGNAELIRVQEDKAGAQDWLKLSWRQVFLYVEESESSAISHMSWQQILGLSSVALGYDVKINHTDDDAGISFTREGIELHVFTGFRAVVGAYEFLLGNLAFNSCYYPDETFAMSPEELCALCCAHRELYSDGKRKLSDIPL